MTRSTRRQFMQDVAFGGAAGLVASGRQAAAQGSSDASPWSSRIGLELYTVRDLLAADHEGTLVKVAEIGYTETSSDSSRRPGSPG